MARPKPGEFVWTDLRLHPDGSSEESPPSLEESPPSSLQLSPPSTRGPGMQLGNARSAGTLALPVGDSSITTSAGPAITIADRDDGSLQYMMQMTEGSKEDRKRKAAAKRARRLLEGGFRLFVAACEAESPPRLVAAREDRTGMYLKVASTSS